MQIGDMMRPMRRLFIFFAAAPLALLPPLSPAGACPVGEPPALSVAKLEPCAHASGADVEAFRTAHPDLFAKRAGYHQERSEVAICDCCAVVAKAAPGLSAPKSSEDQGAILSVIPIAEFPPLAAERSQGPPVEAIVLSAYSPLYLATARLRL